MITFNNRVSNNLLETRCRRLASVIKEQDKKKPNDESIKQTEAQQEILENLKKEIQQLEETKNQEEATYIKTVKDLEQQVEGKQKE